MAETRPRRRLDSWKEIADYLRREVRTAIRWEKEKGLPVYRVPGGARQAVFAYADEIDAWLLGQNGAASTDLNPFAVRQAPAEVAVEEPPKTAPVGQIGPLILEEKQLGTEEAVAGQPAPSARRTVSLAEEKLVPQWRLRRTWLVIAAVALLPVLVGLPIYLKTHATRSLARVSLSGDKLLAWDEQGRLAWEYRFRDPLYQTIPKIRGGWSASWT